MLPVLPGEIFDKHDALLKGQSQMISKTQQGNRMVYHYLMPDGTTKMVTKPIKVSSAKPKQKQEDENKQPRQKKAEERTQGRDPKAPEAPKQVKQSYLPLPEHEFAGKLMGIQRTNVSTDRVMDSWTGIPLKWKCYDSGEKELHVMTSSKFRLSAVFAKNVVNPYTIELRVENISSGEAKLVYGKKVKVDLNTFEEGYEAVISALSFLSGNPEIISATSTFAKSNTSHYLDDIEKFLNDTKEGVDASYPISVLEFALESRYFKKKAAPDSKIITGE